jgi:hypothetical protein
MISVHKITNCNQIQSFEAAPVCREVFSLLTCLSREAVLACPEGVSVAIPVGPIIDIRQRMSNGGGARRRSGDSGPSRLPKWKADSPRSGASRHGARGFMNRSLRHGLGTAGSQPRFRLRFRWQSATARHQEQNANWNP